MLVAHVALGVESKTGEGGREGEREGGEQQGGVRV